MQQPLRRRMIVLVLLGCGVFQLIGALAAMLLWWGNGDWRPYVPVIVVVALLLAWPLAYELWKQKS